MALDKKNGNRSGGMEDIKLSIESPAGETNRIKDSIKRLNQAAKTKQEEISSVVGMKYEDIRHKISEARDSGKMKFAEAKLRTSDAIHNGTQKVKDAASAANNTVHANPWPFLGGVALAGFGVGLLVMSQIKRQAAAPAKTEAEIVAIPGNSPVTKSVRVQSANRQSATARGPQI